MLPLAVADAYTLLVPSVGAIFLAGPGGPAAGLVPRAGHRLFVVPASALQRVGPAGKAAALARLVPGTLVARRLLRAHGSRLVIGSGGFASGCVLLAARSLGLRTALIEPNVVPGLANSLLKRLVARVYVSFDEAAARFSAEVCVRTGTPLRPAIVERLQAVRRRPPHNRCVRVLVLDGSRGSGFFARHIPPFLGSLTTTGIHVEVRHQSAAPEDVTLRVAYAAAGVPATVESFLDRIEEAYAWADVAITRAGATTLAELAIAGLPSLVVPLSDAAGDHQAANARAHADTGAALWTRESDWDEGGLVEALASVLLSPDRWQHMAECARRAAAPDAAGDIVRDCERTMRGQW
jgi:UDP-N-acetylglucosamine--N-acetylmuramyl-(pentapeptide) pyrophosphoryl-undecaprenol N-acetylglucosamine transferase